MKITKAQLRRLINEVTQGEMEFQGLEDARRAYLEDKNDDTRHELGLMINKLVEPILAKMGFFWQTESYYSGGQIVFESFDPRIDITIDPVGKMGRYDVGIHPMDEELKFNPIQMSVDTMKGALQFISDTLGEQGMVGEPEAQTELPLGRRGLSRLPKWRRTAKEHKVRITKSQLQQVIREEIQKEAHEGGEGVHDIFNLPEPEAVEPSGDPKVDALRQIVADKQYAKVDGVNIDMQTASLLLQVIDGLNPQNRENFLGRPIEQMADIAYKILGKQ